MTIQNANIKTGLCATAQIYFLNKLMEGSERNKRKPLNRDKAYVMLTLICVVERQTKLCILDNFETLYKKVILISKNN